MPNREKQLAKQRHRRRYHVRNKVRGTADRPRLHVFRSSRHLECQIIDDSSGATLVAASTREPSLRETRPYGGNCAAATALGQALAERAQQAGIRQVRFDRGMYKYHGRVAALADAAREAGLSL